MNILTTLIVRPKNLAILVLHFYDRICGFTVCDPRVWRVYGRPVSGAASQPTCAALRLRIFYLGHHLSLANRRRSLRRITRSRRPRLACHAVAVDGQSRNWLFLDSSSKYCVNFGDRNDHFDGCNRGDVDAEGG